MISVAIVEDDREIREGLRRYLDNQSNLECRMVADSVEAMLRHFQEAPLPQVVLMDIGLPGMSGIDGIRLIREKYPSVEIIMLTIYMEHNRIFDSLCAGASGYLLKNTPLPEIKEGIEMLFQGGSPMSPQIARKVIAHFNPGRSRQAIESPLSGREKEIVIGLVDGLSYKMIADRMHISIETVRYHIKNIYQKLQVHCKAEVISKSLKGEI